MNVYLVGGAVRDQLLGLPVKDRDWVVEGATSLQLLEAGYKQVGRNFPVFLHPKTGEEYALARKERKTARGHHGFIFHFSPEVRLEEDLQRRDLTINAIAQTVDGQLIDPYGGRADIRARLLRHVSPAFQEDPLRVLRVLRFWARFHHLGFRIAPETWILCQKIVTSGELEMLSGERIWQECEKSLKYRDPQLFFDGLYQLGAIKLIVDNFVPDKEMIEKMSAQLVTACNAVEEAHQRLAAWTWGYPEVITSITHKMPMANRYKYWINLVNDWGEAVKNWSCLTKKMRWNLFKSCDGLRAAGEVLALLKTVNVPLEAQQIILQAQQRVWSIKTEALRAQGLQNKALGDAIKEAQMSVL